VPGVARRAKTGWWQQQFFNVSSLDLSFIRAVRARPWLADAGAQRVASTMWYVYIIRSVEFPDQEYTGATEDLKRRISDHNAGKSSHTAKFKP
jgi:hypothetical protein